MHHSLFFSSLACAFFLFSCSYMTWPEIVESVHVLEVVEEAIEKEVEDATVEREK